MKYHTGLLLIILTAGCNTPQKGNEDNQKDTMSVSEETKVEKILSNDDSLIKAKEKELIEKYK